MVTSIVRNEKEYKSTYLLVEKKLKEKAKEKGINFTKVFREALLQEIKRIDSKENDFAGPTFEPTSTHERADNAHLVFSPDKCDSIRV